MKSNRSGMLWPFRIAFLAWLGMCMAGSAFAKSWTMKDGTKIRANVLKYDVFAKKLTLIAGEVQETVALDDLSKEDQEWITRRFGVLQMNRKKVAQPAPDVDKEEIFSLLGKSEKEVAGSLKKLNLVENAESVKIEKRRSRDDAMDIVEHQYDKGRLFLQFVDDGLITMSFHLKDGYAGKLPFGLKKDMGVDERDQALEGKGFQLTDWGTCDPGWGVVRALDASPEKLVAILTEKPDSPEIAILRLKVDQ